MTLRTELDACIGRLQEAHAERLMADVRTVEAIAAQALDTGSHTALTAGLILRGIHASPKRAGHGCL